MALPLLGELAERLSGQPGLDIDGLSLLTPVIYPDKVLAVGANYSGHMKEMGLAVRKWDSMPFFVRPPTTTLVGPGPTVRIPRSTKQFDWECEFDPPPPKWSALKYGFEPTRGRIDAEEDPQA